MNTEPAPQHGSERSEDEHRRPGEEYRAGERWGWELRAPEVALPVPFDEEPPALPEVKASWTQRLAGRRDRTVQGWTAHVRRFLTLGLTGAATVASTSLPWGFAPWITAGLGSLTALSAYFAARPLVLPWWGDVRYRRWRDGVLAQQEAVAEQTRQWAARRDAFENELLRQERPERWEPLRPATSHRVDVYGGEPRGLEALLLSVAGSLLDSGAPVTVVDLSQDGICHALVHRSVNRRHRVFAASLPEDMAEVGLLHGLTPEDIGGVVSESVHLMERERTAGGDKTLDATLIEQVAACLAPPVSFRRLYLAVRCVAQQEGRPEGLTEAEYERLEELLGENARRVGEGRLFRLTAALQRLAGLEPAGEGRSRDAAHAAATAALQVWDLSDRVGELGGELLAQVVLQVLIHRLRHADQQPGRVLMLLGADRFRRPHLERLDQLARRRGVRLVLFFRHLREDAVELLGGGEAVMFMRLGNAKEAEHAANFIGKDHRLVLSQFTVQHSSSMSTTVSTSTTESVSDQDSVTKGRQWSWNRNYHYGALIDFPHDSGSRSRGKQESTTVSRSMSTSTGESRSEQQGTSESRSVGYQRVYEYSVEPRFLQSLSPTAFVLVDPRDPGSPRLGDASPELDAGLRSMAPSPWEWSAERGDPAVHAWAPDRPPPGLRPPTSPTPGAAVGPTPPGGAVAEPPQGAAPQQVTAPRQVTAPQQATAPQQGRVRPTAEHGPAQAPPTSSAPGE